jgi:2,4-dienoyl-CoA reductase-like NADH-dependent reductase (Old Yellow Enzyme family)
MSFDYKTLEDISEDCKRRHLEIVFDRETDILYEPLEIAGRTLGNRVAVHPMEGSDATGDGKPSELTLRRWKRFAESGAKLIWGEAAAVVAEGRSNPRQLLLNERNRAEFKELVTRTRAAHRERFGSVDDLLVGIQLTHAGRHSFEKPAILFHSPVQDAFTFLDKLTRAPLPADYPVVTDEYLERLEDEFVSAAVVARDCGFDFVDVKQCHTYLLNELLAARERPGKYGGSLKNRRSFIRNVVMRIDEAVRGELLIASRLNVYDGVPFVRDIKTGMGSPMKCEIPYRCGWGVDARNPGKEDLSEPKKLVDMLSGLGVKIFSISIGSPYWCPHLLRPYTRPVEGGYESPEHPLVSIDRLFRLTNDMQRAFPTVPMIGAGYSWLRQFMLNAAAANVARGNVTIAGFGRGALAYPDFAAEGRSGTLDPKKVCLADSMCSNMLRGFDKGSRKLPTGCPVRDRTYAEVYKQMK